MNRIALAGLAVLALTGGAMAQAVTSGEWTKPMSDVDRSTYITKIHGEHGPGGRCYLEFTSPILSTQPGGRKAQRNYLSSRDIVLRVPKVLDHD